MKEEKRNFNIHKRGYIIGKVLMKYVSPKNENIWLLNLRQDIRRQRFCVYICLCTIIWKQKKIGLQIWLSHFCEVRGKVVCYSKKYMIFWVLNSCFKWVAF